MKPFWEPGSTHGYHAYTFGFLAGELVQRVDPQHRSYSQFVRDELDPEFYVGYSDDNVEARVAPLLTKNDAALASLPPLNPLVENTMSCNGAFPMRSPNSDEFVFNRRSVHQAVLPAANGISNAHSLARIYALLIGDVNENGKKTTCLLSKKTLKMATENVTPLNEVDQTMFGFTSKFSRGGFELYGDYFKVLGEDGFGHHGKKPYWEPGSTHGYHAYTFGFFAGELVQRVDPQHRSYSQFVRDELDPEFYVGISDDNVEARVAPLLTKNDAGLASLPPLNPLVENTMSCNGAFPMRSPNSDEFVFNRRSVHQAVIPAVNGISNAHSLARIYALLIGDVNENGKKTTLVENTMSCNGAFPMRSPNSDEFVFNRRSVHQAVIPAVNGISNAHSLARIYALLIGDVNENGKCVGTP
ncbi:unnamed protein product [Rotaria sordida]|uniref:Beta-lactamase-related domain-containing protein n=1 Tax=Rotaria sordida TaxID=392033 RepID=A0A814L3J9_9BILA|nr:unnamed protein product [Rotaria sordida]